MSNEYSYTIEIKKIYVEIEELNKKGDPKKIPVFLRKMFLSVNNSIGDSGKYKIFARGKKYTISVVPRIRQSIWKHPSGKPGVWYTLPEGVYKRTDDKPMDSIAFGDWLFRRIGQSSVKLLDLFENSEQGVYVNGKEM